MTPDAAAPAGAAKASLSADYARTEISRWQARSMAMSTSGIVAAENPLAAQAGAVVLARGGHAVDAAIAANAVMGVVAPMMNGIGGDLFAIVYDAASNTVHGLNASGWSPAGASIESLTARGLSSDAAAGHSCRDRPGRGGRLDGAAREVRHGAARDDPVGRDCARRERLSGLGDHVARMARQRGAAAQRRQRRRDLPAERPAAGSRRDLPQSGSGALAARHRRPRRRCVLSRRDRRAHPRVLGAIAAAPSRRRISPTTRPSG